MEIWEENMVAKTRKKKKPETGTGEKLKGAVAGLVVWGVGLIFMLPVLFLVSGSLADTLEWSGRLEALTREGADYVTWKWLPDYPTLEHYRKLLFYSPAFFRLFWNSVGMVAAILTGQLLVGVPAAWALATIRFPGRKALFSLYVILMLLPFQVTMLSKYLVMRRFGMLDSVWAVILPAVFSTFPVFLVYRSFLSISRELMEAARIDGAGEWRIFLQIGVPLAKGGVLSALVLDFLEAWNMIEEPMAFLSDRSLWPLSLYLPETGISQAGYSCAASLVTLFLSLFVFAMFSDSLEKGIGNELVLY